MADLPTATPSTKAAPCRLPPEVLTHIIDCYIEIRDADLKNRRGAAMAAFHHFSGNHNEFANPEDREMCFEMAKSRYPIIPLLSSSQVINTIAIPKLYSAPRPRGVSQCTSFLLTSAPSSFHNVQDLVVDLGFEAPSSCCCAHRHAEKEDKLPVVTDSSLEPFQERMKAYLEESGKPWEAVYPVAGKGTFDRESAWPLRGFAVLNLATIEIEHTSLETITEQDYAALTTSCNERIAAGLPPTQLIITVRSYEITSFTLKTREIKPGPWETTFKITVGWTTHAATFLDCSSITNDKRPGVPDEERKTSCTPFYRVHSELHRADGPKLIIKHSMTDHAFCERSNGEIRSKLPPRLELEQTCEGDCTETLNPEVLAFRACFRRMQDPEMGPLLGKMKMWRRRIQDEITAARLEDELEELGGVDSDQDSSDESDDGSEHESSDEGSEEDSDEGDDESGGEDAGDTGEAVAEVAPGEVTNTETETAQGD